MRARSNIQPLLACATLIVSAFCGSAPRAIAQAESGKIPDVPVWTEAERKASLHAELRGKRAGPVILLPIYTRCAASCPTLTRKLKAETEGMNSDNAYRVVLVSFDPAETTETLRAFRGRERLPPQWTILRGDGQEIRQIFDFFSYPIMTEAGVLVHPNKIFLLDRGLNWQSTLAGEDWNSVELQKRLRQIEAPGLVGWASTNPATLVFIGFGGLVASLALLIAWLTVRRPRVPS